MLDFLSKVFKFIERWECYRLANFWFWTIIGYLCFTSLFNELPSFINSPSQVEIVTQEVRGGGKQQYEVINEIINYVDNLAKKKYFKEMQVKHFPDFESRVSLEK